LNRSLIQGWESTILNQPDLELYTACFVPDPSQPNGFGTETGAKMLPAGETMQASLRKTLIDSHVAAAAIAILLLSSLRTALFFLPTLSYWVAPALTAAWKTRDFSQSHLSLNYATSVILPASLVSLFGALACVLAAWLLSRWVYGVGPLRSLGSYRGKLSRRTHA
jgi:hypothetical protein